jgi:AraC-like DNA-binding protein
MDWHGKTLQPAQIQPCVKMVNYFEVGPVASWGEREIQDLELILVVVGTFAYDERGREVCRIEAGDVLCILPDVSHTFRQVDPSTRGVISCIHNEVAAEGQWRRGDYRLEPAPQLLTHTKNDPVIRDLFKRASEAFAGFSLYRGEILCTIVREIWLRLAEHWTARGGRRMSSRVKQMETHLREHLAERVTRRDLARLVSITPEHVNALFRKELGVTPTEFLNRERIHLAYRLLANEGLSVKEAAARVGISDPFYFSKLFKRITGTPPSRVLR